MRSWLVCWATWETCSLDASHCFDNRATENCFFFFCFQSKQCLNPSSAKWRLRSCFGCRKSSKMALGFCCRLFPVVVPIISIKQITQLPSRKIRFQHAIAHKNLIQGELSFEIVKRKINLSRMSILYRWLLLIANRRRDWFVWKLWERENETIFIMLQSDSIKNAKGGNCRLKLRNEEWKSRSSITVTGERRFFGLRSRHEEC